MSIALLILAIAFILALVVAGNESARRFPSKLANYLRGRAPGAGDGGSDPKSSSSHGDSTRAEATRPSANAPKTKAKTAPNTVQPDGSVDGEGEQRRSTAGGASVVGSTAGRDINATVITNVIGDTRAILEHNFISLAEFRASAAEGLLDDAFDQPLENRREQLDRVLAFVAEPNTRLLLVHGPGGVGKTRLLYEAALAASQQGLIATVYAATRTAEVSNNWYSSIAAEDPTLIIIDEPRETAFIDVLLDQLRRSANKWKVVVAVRSPNHPVVRVLREPRLSIASRPDLELRALSPDGADSLARHLVRAHLALSQDAEVRVVSWLTSVSKRVPIWITIGVRLLKERGNSNELPADRWGVARGYLTEILSRGPSEVASETQLRTLLRWLALLQPVNQYDSETLEFLRIEALFANIGEVQRAIASLRQRRVITCYGIEDRLVEIRPDVMRDFIVRDWLTLPVDPDASDGARLASADAGVLVQRFIATATGNDSIPALRRAITSLGRLEREVQPELRLLDPLVTATLGAARAATTAAEQQDVLEIAQMFSAFRPREFAQLIGVVRESSVPSGYHALPGFAQGIEITRTRVLISLPWLLFNVAGYADIGAERDSIIAEMCALLEAEAEAPYASSLPYKNDGKRAFALLPRMLGAERRIASFEPEAREIADRLLDQLEAGRLPPSLLLETILRTLLSVRRSETHWDRFSITVTQGVLPIEHPAAQEMFRYRERLWKIVRDRVLSEKAHLQAWKLLQENQSLANMDRPDLKARQEAPEDADNTSHASSSADSQESSLTNPAFPGPDWTFLVRDNIARTRDLAKSSSFTNAEWFAARKLWEWHMQHDPNEECRALAEEAERIFRMDPVRGPLAALLLNDDVDDESLLSQTAEELSGRDATSLRQFMQQALDFASDAESWRVHKLHDIAYRLAGDGTTLPSNMRSYVEMVVQDPTAKLEHPLAYTIFGAFLRNLRRAHHADMLEHEVAWLLGLVTSVEQRRAMLLHLYGDPNTQRNLIARDVSIVLANLAMFADDDKQVATMLGLCFIVDFTGIRAQAQHLFEEVFLRTPFELVDVFASFLRGFHAQALRDSFVITRDSYEWLMEIFSWIPNLPRFSSLAALERISRIQPKFDLPWLVQIIENRQQRLLPLLQRERATLDSDDVAWILTRDFPFTRLVNTLDSSRTVTGPERQSVEKLLAMNDATVYVSEYLPELIASIDPEGLVAPNVVVRSLNAATHHSVDEIAAWCRYARPYPIASAAWRMIAEASCLLAERTLASAELPVIYTRLSTTGGTVIQGRVGEVPAHYQDSVARARQAVADEGEGPLQRYFRWRLQSAERDLKHEHERLEEEGFTDSED